MHFSLERPQWPLGLQLAAFFAGLAAYTYYTFSRYAEGAHFTSAFWFGLYRVFGVWAGTAIPVLVSVGFLVWAAWEYKVFPEGR